jgi:hypothetical protein
MQGFLSMIQTLVKFSQGSKDLGIKINLLVKPFKDSGGGFPPRYQYC